VRRSLGRLCARQHELVLGLRSKWLVRRLSRSSGLADGRATPERGIAGAMDTDAILQLLAIQAAWPCPE